ncbi:MAG: hypothetical protein ACRD8U_14620 [Pyrinomonadaceae bacterium]
MRRTILWNLSVATLASLIIFSSPAVSQNRRVAKAGMAPERLARITPQLESFVKQGTMVGSVTLIARRGQIVSLEAIGYQDLENKRPMPVIGFVTDLMSKILSTVTRSRLGFERGSNERFSSDLTRELWAQRGLWRDHLD